MFFVKKITSTPFIFQKGLILKFLNLLLITNEEKSHYVFIKDLDELMYSKAKTKNQHKKTFIWLVTKFHY